MYAQLYKLQILMILREKPTLLIQCTC